MVVLGTGGMGREALAWAVDTVGAGAVVGFLDEDEARHGATVAGMPVLGGLGWLDAHANIEVVLAIGAPAARAQVDARLRDRGVRLASLVHPTAVVGPRSRVGEGTIVCPGVVLTCDVHVGRAVILNYGAAVGHDGRIGDHAFVGPGARLAGTVTVGARAEVGIGASVIQDVTIGADAVVGAGAAVVRDIPAGATAVGVPARPIGGGR